MKQWLNDGWFKFKTWVVFTWWKCTSNEDLEDLKKLYYLKLWEKHAMKEYVEHINGRKYEKVESWYAGTIPNDYMDRINAKIAEKKEK